MLKCVTTVLIVRGAVIENLTGKAVEHAAIEFVVARERAVGRDAQDVRGTGAAADINSPPRMIEVKTYGGSARGSDLWLEPRQFVEARTNPQFYVYVVENVRQGDPDRFTLKELGGDRLARLLERAKEQRHYTVPWPVADYDLPSTS
jgi:Domain of unknown function (DUF3883)